MKPEKSYLRVLMVAVFGLLSLTGCRMTDGEEMGPHIVDQLENASRYYSLNGLFEQAFEFVRSHDLKNLAIGRYEIVGDDCYAMVQEPVLKPASEGRYELHKDYFDIQLPIDGEEVYGLVATPDSVLDAAEWKGKDILFFDAPMETVTVRPGEFAILAPLKGAHAPCLTDGEPQKLKKLVIKVRAGW